MSKIKIPKEYKESLFKRFPPKSGLDVSHSNSPCLMCKEYMCPDCPIVKLNGKSCTAISKEIWGDNRFVIFQSHKYVHREAYLFGRAKALRRIEWV